MGDGRDVVGARKGSSRAPVTMGDGLEADDAVGSCRHLRCYWEMDMSMGACRDVTGDRQGARDAMGVVAISNGDVRWAGRLTSRREPVAISVGDGR